MYFVLLFSHLLAIGLFYFNCLFIFFACFTVVVNIFLTDFIFTLYIIGIVKYIQYNSDTHNKVTVLP